MMTIAKLPAMTIAKLHDSLDRRETTVLATTEKFLKAVQSNQLNAFLTICEDRALDQAKKADAILSKEGKVPRDRLPLLGVPLALKDNLVVAGVRTTCGSKILGDYLPPYSATVVTRLEAAGAVTVGKTNLDEFAMGSSNENSAFGPVLHPTHTDRVPGGSSGGSAAAVRAGLCLAALGSDTGGSIRLPASYCGVVGFKPTYGRVSRSGLVAFASSLDQVGPLTRSVRDAAILTDVMGGPDALDSTSWPERFPAIAAQLDAAMDWSKLRIGVPEEWMCEGLSSEVDTAIRASLDWFRTRGAQMIPVTLSHTKYSIAVYYLVAVSEASSNLSRFDGVRFGSRPHEADQAKNLEEFYQTVRAQFGAEVKRRIILGTFALSSGYADAYYHRACQVRRLIAQDFDHAFSQVDLIATPVCPTTAFRMGEKADPLQMYLNDLYTIPANLAGLPAVSLPCGEDSQGLSIGLQLMAPRFADQKLLSVAHAFEQGRA